MDENTLLTFINSPDDIKQFSLPELDRLCYDIRVRLIDTIATNGGHLASNLGVVELTVALHKVFSSPEDQIVWDVGHQCYTHKLITGRNNQFETLRCEGGLSGFCRPDESIHDPFVSGHSSTSISAAFGLATAKSLQGLRGHSIAIIGDGALTGGLAYEALNNAGRSHEKMIVILNDNRMSISKNVGAIARHLAIIRSKPGYFRFKRSVERFLHHVPLAGKPLERTIAKSKVALKSILYNNTIFENMGFAYIGPVDGHDLPRLINVLEACKTVRRPVLLHVCTVKGKGYEFAEKDPRAFHGTTGFDVETGGAPTNSPDSFSNKFGSALTRLADHDHRICAVTAAMTPGTGLTEFAQKHRNRLFDVGIAEEHAVTFSSGLAKNGILPVFAVYSTFLQRGYDQIIHDAALQNAHIILAIDRAGIVGDDGETHQGVFDTCFLNSIPNVTVFSPSCYYELENMLDEAVYHCTGVVAIRYPRGSEPSLPSDYQYSGSAYSLYGNLVSENVIVTYGRQFGEVCIVADTLKKSGIETCILKLNRIKPLDESCLTKISNYKRVFFFEEGIKTGGIGEHFGFMLFQAGFKGKYTLTAIPDLFLPQSSARRGLEKCGLDAKSMAETIMMECNH